MARSAPSRRRGHYQSRFFATTPVNALGSLCPFGDQLGQIRLVRSCSGALMLKTLRPETDRAFAAHQYLERYFRM